MTASRHRRGLMAAAVLALLTLTLPAPTAGQTPSVTRELRYMMGTSIAVEVSGRDEATRRAAIAEVFGAFAEVDRLMSNYRDDSELARVNLEAARGAVPVSAPLFAVLTAAERVSRQSNGAFDVTIGPAMVLWGFHDRRPHLPTPAELAAIRPLVDYRTVLLDPARSTVRVTRPGISIDLGGIAKGFAVELGAGVVRRHGLSGFIDAGGNQYMVGTPVGKKTWTVGVKSPDAKDRLLGVLELGEGSVSTSADYSNFMVVDGVAYGHVLDPRTLKPASASLSVTIVSVDGTMADAMSKAAFILGPKAGLALVDAFPGMSAIIAYRQPDGRIGLAISDALKSRFTPAVR